MKMNFNKYVKSKALTSHTVESFEKVITIFLTWLDNEGMNAVHIRSQDILAFMKYCQTQGAVQRTIQHYLNVVRHYYDCLVEQNEVNANPVLGIQVRGVKRKTLYHIFTQEELHEIYCSYHDETLKGKRNKIILSLLVYQGVKTEELPKLEVCDVKLKEGKIEMNGGPKSERRILDLEPNQVFAFNEYITGTRKEILEQSQQETDKLFVSIEGGDSFNSCMTRLMFWVKRNNKLVVNAKQLRASVIVKWLQIYNLRQVQYLAGHRFISSTEAYQQSDMEGLTEEVNMFHPLG
jgi:integrase/recombinase XerD